MKKEVPFLIRTIAFCFALWFIIMETNAILVPKKFFDDTWPTTSTYKGFYQMEKDSIDVLFLGSSHAAAGFNPQEIYDDFGIRSYNLGCEQQNMLVSYFWLKEALRYQTPKVVVLDTYMLFEFNRLEPLNTSEPSTRMAMDAMRWSRVKYEAVKAICDNDAQQSFGSYIFKNIRFHSRWKDLAEQDFTFKSMEKHYELKGWVPLDGKVGDYNYQPFDNFDTDIFETPVSLMAVYFEKIKELCDENGIKLIFVKTPSATWAWNTSKHNYVSEYAKRNKIDFFDFNMKDIYDRSGFFYADDMSDNGHSNVWGAAKISSFLSGMLSAKYEINEDESNEQWIGTQDYYQKILADSRLKYITDLDEYINALNEERYTILISTKNDMTFCMNEETLSAFARLGLDLNSRQNESYCAAITDCGTFQLASDRLINYIGSTRGKLDVITIVSGGCYVGNQSSIQINNVEYSKNGDGINIVVYSGETRKVIDSALYDGTLHR